MTLIPIEFQRQRAEQSARKAEKLLVQRERQRRLAERDAAAATATDEASEGSQANQRAAGASIPPLMTPPQTPGGSSSSPPAHASNPLTALPLLPPAVAHPAEGDGAHEASETFTIGISAPIAIDSFHPSVSGVSHSMLGSLGALVGASGGGAAASGVVESASSGGEDGVPSSSAPVVMNTWVLQCFDVHTQLLSDTGFIGLAQMRRARRRGRLFRMAPLLMQLPLAVWWRLAHPLRRMRPSSK
jgi:hypothetical protein